MRTTPVLPAGVKPALSTTPPPVAGASPMHAGQEASAFLPDTFSRRENAGAFAGTDPAAGRAGPNPMFDYLPQEFSEHSMPHRAVWMEFVTPAIMTEAIQMADPKGLMALKVSPYEMMDLQARRDTPDWRRPALHKPMDVPIDVVDIGSGYGDFMALAAKSLYQANGGKRKIKAIGLEYVPEVIGFARQVAEKEHQLGRYADYEFIQHDLFDPKDIAARLKRIPNSSVRLVILSSMLHMGAERNTELFKEAKRVLVPGGRLVLTHWYKGYPERGPEDALRPLPEEIVTRGLWGNTNLNVEMEFHQPGHKQSARPLTIHRALSGQMDFIGYKPLSAGMYAVILENPPNVMDDPEGRAVTRATVARSLGDKSIALCQSDWDMPDFDIYLLGLARNLKRLKTQDESALFLEGLVWNQCISNPWFLRDVWNAYARHPEVVPPEVAALMTGEHRDEMPNDQDFRGLKTMIAILQDPANVRPELHASLKELVSLPPHAPMLQKVLADRLKYFEPVQRHFGNLSAESPEGPWNYFPDPRQRYINPLYFESRRRVLCKCYAALARTALLSGKRPDADTDRNRANAGSTAPRSFAFDFLPEMAWLMLHPSVVPEADMMITPKLLAVARPVFEKNPTLTSPSQINWSQLFTYANHQTRRIIQQKYRLENKPFTLSAVLSTEDQIRALQEKIKKAKSRPVRLQSRIALRKILESPVGQFIYARAKFQKKDDPALPNLPELEN